MTTVSENAMELLKQLCAGGKRVRRGKAIMGRTAPSMQLYELEEAKLVKRVVATSSVVLYEILPEGLKVIEGEKKL